MLERGIVSENRMQRSIFTYYKLFGKYCEFCGINNPQSISVDKNGFKIQSSKPLVKQFPLGCIVQSETIIKQSGRETPLAC